MINLTPAQQQLVNILLAVFTASGPVVGLLLVKQGFDPSTINILSTWAASVGPLILSGIAIYVIHTPQAAVLTAGKVDGATVGVDTSASTQASPAVVAAANSNDPAHAGVQPLTKLAA